MRSTRGVERLLVAAAAALAATVATGGCRGPLDAPRATANTPEDAPRRGGTLHLATFGDVSTLDPAAASDQLTTSVLRLVYAGLLDFDADGHVVPDLATKVDLTDDGRTYRFTLHEGVRFHDGSELTAADVKRSIERALHPGTPSSVASFYRAIDGFPEFTGKSAEHLGGVVVEGRYVIAIHLRERDATFLPVLALVPLRVTCPSAGETYSASWVPCGAGPFRVPPGGWEHGRTLTLVRHQDYFRPGLPYLDAVTWELGSTSIAEGFKFASGDLDIVRDLNQGDTVRYQADPRWQPFGTREPPGHIVQGEAMNTEVPPFDNVEVRRAVAAAIDREHLVLLKASNLSAVTRPVPDGLPGYDPPPVGQTHDLAVALEHMKKAGYAFDPATGRGGWPRVVPYDLSRGLFESTAQSIQQDLATIGIKLELRISSFPTYLAVTHRRGKAAMSPQGAGMSYPDPNDFLEPRFSSASIGDVDGRNYAFYANPTVDDLLARAKRELDGAERTHLYGEVERIVCDEAPWAFEYSYRFYEMRQPYVRGYRMPAVWVNDVIPVWLDKALGAQAREGAPFSRQLLGSLLGGSR